MIKIFSLENLLSDSAHKSTIFEPAQIEAVEAAAYKKIVRGKETPFIKCFVRNKEIRLTPEEASAKCLSASSSTNTVIKFLKFLKFICSASNSSRPNVEFDCGRRQD